MELIDIHSHYAWDIDDGIANLDDAKKALTKAKNQNIKRIFLYIIKLIAMGKSDCVTVLEMNS